MKKFVIFSIVAVIAGTAGYETGVYLTNRFVQKRLKDVSPLFINAMADMMTDIGEGKIRSKDELRKRMDVELNFLRMVGYSQD